MGLFLAQIASEGLDAVEQAGTFQPQVAPLPTAVALSILGVFFLLRQRTDGAIAARATRLDAEESLRIATASNLAGDVQADLEEEKMRLAMLLKAEEDLMTIPGTSFRLRLPPAPQQAEDFYKKEAAKFNAPPTGGAEEERLAPWQEALIVGATTLILAPFLLLAVVDPMKGASINVEQQLANDPNAPPARPAPGKTPKPAAVAPAADAEL